jgi:hypothetical protein
MARVIEYYKDLETIPIEDYEKVAEAPTKSPFSENLGPQAAVSKKSTSRSEDSKYFYVESTVHGRTIDEKASSGKVFWGGPFKCDKFGGRDLKGSREEYPYLNVRKLLRKNPTLSVSGLYDETDVPYLIKASEYLRSNGLPTENIVAIYKPNEIAVDGKLIPIAEWRRKATEQLSKDLSMINRQDPELFKQGVEFINNAEFFQVEREVQVTERIRDLARCKNKEQFLKVIENPLKWINVATKVKHEGIIPGTEQPDPFDINSEEDIKRYLENWLPTQMGVYLGRLKKMGINNDYGHAQQWNLAATMDDAQSYSGEVLGTSPQKSEDYVYALTDVLGVLEELFNPSVPNYVKRKYGESLAIAKENLLVSYFNEIDLENDPDKVLYSYKSLMDNTFFDGSISYYRPLEPEIYIKCRNKLGFKLSSKEVDNIFKTYYFETEKIIDQIHKGEINDRL